MAKFAKLLSSAARTTTTASDHITNYDDNEATHIVVDITALSGVNVVPHVMGYDPTSGKSYEILAGSVLTSTGTTVLKVGPQYTAAANIAKDYLPYDWYVNVVVSGVGSGATFSVGASII